MFDPRFALRLAATGAALLSLATAALAFSQIDPGEDGGTSAKEGIIAVPLPPLDDEAEDEAATGEPRTGAGEAPAGPSRHAAPAGPTPPAPPAAGVDGPAANEAAAGTEAAGAAIEPVRYGEDGLPAPVRDLRRKLVEIARRGDIEALRPYLQASEGETLLSFGDQPDDPIAFLRQASGDGQGIEVLAILLEILEAGHAHADIGTDSEIFVWPYFAQADLERLTPPQKVELFELVTAGDFEAMQGFGAYNFWRAGISPEGRLEFFVAGD